MPYYGYDETLDERLRREQAMLRSQNGPPQVPQQQPVMEVPSEVPVIPAGGMPQQQEPPGPPPIPQGDPAMMARLGSRPPMGPPGLEAPPPVPGIAEAPPPIPPPSRYQRSPEQQRNRDSLDALRTKYEKPVPKWQTGLAMALSVLPRTRPIAGMIPNEGQRQAHLANISNTIADNDRQEQMGQWAAEDRGTQQAALAEQRKLMNSQAAENTQTRRLGLMGQGWETPDPAAHDRYQTIENVGGKQMGLPRKSVRAKEEAAAKQEVSEAGRMPLFPDVAKFHKVPEGTRVPPEQWAQMTMAASKPPARVPPRPGILGEFDFYKEQGGTKDFTGYQNEDANRRRPTVNVNMGGLDSRQASAFQRIAGKYQASPLIKASDKTNVLVKAISDLRQDPGNGALQLPVIYSYIKALDMYDSAVREGEISLAKEIMSWKDKVESYLTKATKEGQILNGKAALEMAKSAENLVGSMRESAAAKSKAFESEANVIGLGKQWKEYTGGFAPSYDKPAGDAAPKVEKWGRDANGKPVKLAQ